MFFLWYFKTVPAIFTLNVSFSKFCTHRVDNPKNGSWAIERKRSEDLAKSSAPAVDPSNLGQAPKGSCKNNFPCLGAETPVWQGARTAHTPSYGKDEQRSQTGWIDSQT